MSTDDAVLSRAIAREAGALVVEIRSSYGEVAYGDRARIRALCSSSTWRRQASACATSRAGKSWASASSDEVPAIRPTMTFFRTLRRFTRLWCWKIIAVGRRASRRPRSRVRTAWPSITTSPASGGTSPLTQRSRVDLPAPLGPSTTRNSPARTDRSTCFRTRRWP